MRLAYLSTLPPSFGAQHARNFKGCTPPTVQKMNGKGGRRARFSENRKIREPRGPADRSQRFTRQRNLDPWGPWATALPAPAAACRPAPGRRTSSRRPRHRARRVPTGHCAGLPGEPAGGRPPAGTARPGLYSAGSVVSGRANCTPYTAGTAPRRYSATAWSFSFSS